MIGWLHKRKMLRIAWVLDMFLMLRFPESVSEYVKRLF